MVKIVLRGPNGEEHHVELGSEDVVIGRESGCQIQIEDPLISRRHARVGWRVVTEDLGSTNGMWKEGRRLQSAVLEPDQPITLGRGEKFVLALDAGPGAPPLGPGNGASPDALRERDQRIQTLESEVKELRLRPPYDSWKEVCRRLEESQKTIAEQEARIDQLKRGTVLPSDDGTVEREELRKALEKAKQSLRDRDRRIETLERELQALRGGAVGAETHEDLRQELEQARARLRDRETQMIASHETRLDAPSEDTFAALERAREDLETARERIRELEARPDAPAAPDPAALADKDRRIGELERALDDLRSAAPPPAAQPLTADAAQALARALGSRMLDGHDLRPRETLLDETMRLLVHLHRIVAGTDEAIARSLENFRGVLMPLASLVPDAGEGYVTTMREYLLLGSDRTARALTTYLEELEGRAKTIMSAYGRGAEVWIQNLLDKIGPRAMRREARLPEEGKLATRHAGKLWLRYEGVMLALDARTAASELNEYVAKAIIELTHRP